MFKDNKGKISFLRVASFIALITSVILCLAGIVGFFMQLSNSITVIATSEALIALVLGAKVWQKMSEKSLGQ